MSTRLPEAPLPCICASQNPSPVYLYLMTPEDSPVSSGTAGSVLLVCQSPVLFDAFYAPGRAACQAAVVAGERGARSPRCSPHTRIADKSYQAPAPRPIVGPIVAAWLSLMGPHLQG